MLLSNFLCVFSPRNIHERALLLMIWPGNVDDVDVVSEEKKQSSILGSVVVVVERPLLLLLLLKTCTIVTKCLVRPNYAFL